MDELELRARILGLVKNDLPNLAPHLRHWSECHLVSPREITLALDPNGRATSLFWLVTDHTGSEDSSSRVVFDTRSDQFGLAMELANHVDWYMGPYGSFADSIRCM